MCQNGSRLLPGFKKRKGQKLEMDKEVTDVHGFLNAEKM